MNPFQSSLIAGFECGKLPGRSLIAETLHTPTLRMAEHFRIAKQHGMHTVRDGLPPGSSVWLRMRTAAKADVQPIWDIQHQWVVGNPQRYTGVIASQHAFRQPHAPLWVCNNEPAIMPMFTPTSREESVRIGIEMITMLRDQVETCVLTTDPFRDGSDIEFRSTDQFVAAGCADVIGLNMYPHLLRREPREIIAIARARYPGMPVIIAETSWHDGYHAWPGIENKGDWFRYMQAQGADALCWYPIVDTPDWNDRSMPRWPHGLIREDLSIDRHLSEAILNSRVHPNQVFEHVPA